MAVTYGFYNSVNGDRKYNAVQMAQIFDGIIEDGVFNSVGTAFAVTPSSGMVISVGAGRAWFNHTWTYNDAPITLTVGTAPVGSLKRIDAVVIEVDENNRSNSIKIIAGTESATPVKPTMVDSDGVHQHALAYISTEAGVTAITATMIASAVGTDTPFVTGPLETVGVTTLYNYWRAEFETWFDHLQDELDSNQAANLQHQIDDLESSKADAEDLAELAQSVSKVGDIKYTMRSSLDDDWALCNGDSVNASEYPELCQFLNEYNKYIDFNNISKLPSNFKTVKSIYANGYWVIAGYSGSQSYYAYASSPNGPWTVQALPNSNYIIRDIAYGDGKWVICGDRWYANTRYAAFVGYNTTLDRAISDWTFKDLWSNETYGSGPAWAIAFNGTTWVICGRRYTNSSTTVSVISYTNNVSGSWTGPVQLPSNFYNSGILYENNKFYVAGIVRDSSSSKYYLNIASASKNSLSSWTAVNVADIDTNHYIKFMKTNGKYIIAYTSAMTFFYSSNINGPWVFVNVLDDYYQDGLYFVEFIDGMWFTGGGRRIGTNPAEGQSIIMTAKSIDGPWNSNIILRGGTDSYSTVDNAFTTIASHDDDIVFSGYKYGGSSYVVHVQKTNGVFDSVLPTITPSDGNAFIRIE